MADDEIIKNLSSKQIADYENKIGFKPAGCCNYLCTIYNTVNKDREIFGDGGLALDELITRSVLLSFLKKFLNDNNTNNIYYISVILPENKSNNTYNIAILKCSDNIAEQEKTTEEAFKKIVEVFTEIYTMFIKNGEPANKYRSDTQYHYLKKSYNEFLKYKNNYKSLITNRLH